MTRMNGKKGGGPCSICSGPLKVDSFSVDARLTDVDSLIREPPGLAYSSCISSLVEDS